MLLESLIIPLSIKLKTAETEHLFIDLWCETYS